MALGRASSTAAQDAGLLGLMEFLRIIRGAAAPQKNNRELSAKLTEIGQYLLNNHIIKQRNIMSRTHDLLMKGRTLAFWRGRRTYKKETIVLNGYTLAIRCRKTAFLSY